MKRFFYSTSGLSKILGVCRRQIHRVAYSHGIEPLVFSSDRMSKHFWTPQHIQQFRRYLKKSA